MTKIMDISQEETQLYDCQYLPARQAALYSDWVLRYIEKDATLRPLYEHEYSIEGVKAFIENSHFSDQRRQILRRAIERQYGTMPLPAKVKQNIEKLSQANTFTVTTGHQPGLMGGPLFVAYKILSVVRMAEFLTTTLPQYEFVPLFWMASEDHDWDEVNHFYFHAKRYEWQTDYSGAVGRYILPDMGHFIEQLPQELQSWAQVYRAGDSWATATRRLIHRLFGDLGVVVVDGDDRDLKSLWKDIVWQELTQAPTKEAVARQNELIERLGGTIQAHVRDINLFYMTGRERLRVKRTGDGHWQTVGGQYAWSLEALRKSVTQEPEAWSPNVMLRPVYQQAILPNAVYMGGPGELAYWLQLRKVFSYWRQVDAHIQMPVVGLRHSLFVLTPSDWRKIEKNALQPQDFFRPVDALIKEWLAAHVHETDVFDSARAKITEAHALLLPEIDAVDASLHKKVKAYEVQALKQIDDLEKRFYKAVKQREETAVRQIQSVHERLFPGGVPQERHDSLFTFFIYHREKEYWKQLLQKLIPFRTDVLLLKENS
ncbi:MAG: putative cysteine ligase BshC [Thermonema sp.]|uniref:bacillithiol biosynthesis cysteine-adding enzyme BshC n=1 Tax=Thermonema sp. TaxID=2231181 RepID=UPI0021DDF21E|nr:bacillithiol biosynthesis cysteine-adding enzyme BshC [Thermonema sp.]GIV38650.1 MAG: putative cysteine ligase BshC [Thermonema sp.]